MKFIKGLLITLVALLVVWVILALFSPSETHVERNIEIDAPAETVWSNISVFKNWESWSPWKEKDPTIDNTYSGNDGEVGSRMSWTSDSSGVGYMEILEVIPNEKLVAKLAFTEPWESSSEDTFILSETDGKTTVTWSDHINIPFFARPMMMFMGINSEMLDASMGPDFEKGLENIKSLSETNEIDVEVSKVEMNKINFLGIRHNTTMAEVMTQEFFASNYQKIYGVVATDSIPLAGNASCIYFTWNVEDSTSEAFPCIPVDSNYTVAPEGMELVSIEASNMVKGTFQGPYNGAMVAHIKIGEYCKANNIKTGLVYEEYVNAATAASEEELITNIYYQIIE